MKNLFYKHESFFYTLFTIITLIVVWQIASMTTSMTKVFPAPQAVVEKLYEMSTGTFAKYSLFEHIAISLERVLIAFLAAVVLGIPLGLFMGWSDKVDAFVKPIFEIVRPIPPIAWIPLAILWFGVGETPKIALCFLASFIPAVVNSYTGIKYVNPLLLDVALTLGAKPRSVFLEVAVPSALPAIFAGLQNGISVGWMTVVAAEMFGATSGVGFIILKGQDLSNPTIIVSGMIVIGLLGALISIIIRLLERVICPWKREI
ncbi:MAG: ABC transporter permease [Negativicutes bacterium]|nr:ABC transporter permease [Negativicutes bacterium]